MADPPDYRPENGEELQDRRGSGGRATFNILYRGDSLGRYTGAAAPGALENPHQLVVAE